MDSMRHLVVRPFLADVEAWSARGWCPPGLGSTAIARLLLRHAGLRATLVHRVAHWAAVNRIPGLPMLLQAANLALHGIEMSPSIPVGPGFYMPHTAGSVIHAEAVGIGVEVQGGVTIGQRAGDGFPVLEDGCMVGAGARVLGAIRVGAGGRVGAGAVVLRDVPPDTTVVGVPARVVTAPSPSVSISVPGMPAAARSGGLQAEATAADFGVA